MNEMAESGGVGVIMDAMREHGKDTKVQLYGRSTLRKLIIVA